MILESYNTYYWYHPAFTFSPLMSGGSPSPPPPSHGKKVKDVSRYGEAFKPLTSTPSSMG